MNYKKEPRRSGRGRTKSVGANVLNHSTPIYVGSKVVGQVCTEIFYKSIIGSKHLLRKPPAIAFDISSLNDSERAGAMWIEVKDNESGNIFKATIQQVREQGFKLNRGFGDQIALPLEYWQRNNNPKQLSMFKRGDYAVR